MAELTVGTVYEWGADGATVTSGDVQNISISTEYTTSVEVLDADGNVVAVRLDNPVRTGSLTFLYSALDYSIIGAGTKTISIDIDGTAVTYRVTGVSQSQSNEGYREATLNVEYDEALDGP